MSYLSILGALVAVQVDYALIGTWALCYRYESAMAGYTPPDCDLVVAADVANLERLVQCLQARGWAVEVWGEALRMPLDMAQLAGKYYLRATCDSLRLDITYECHIPWAQLRAGAVMEGGLPLASTDDILYLKRRKAEEQGDFTAYADVLRRLGR